jgi:rRNA-processing protein FCF1
MNERRVHCILDANVIFDLSAGDILEYPCSLPYIFHTTDFVLDEIESLSLAELEGCGLTLIELPSEMLIEIRGLRSRHLFLSLADLSVFIYARHSGHMILTGDGPLWTLAHESGIDVHGTLWLLDQLVGQGVLGGPDASKALQRMMERKRWLPGMEVQKRIKEWGRE